METEDRFKILKKEKIDKNIYYYLKDFFKQLNIEILGRFEGNLFDLMNRGMLEGWCWQTTESAALFMPEDVIIYRGDLHFSNYNTYYHSFIEFEYEGKKYVFDPCLCLINTSNLYFNVLKVEIKGKVSAKEIKEYFINYINNPPKKEKRIKSHNFEECMKEIFGDDYLEKNKNEIVISDKEDPSAPMYRNGSGYKDINIENNKVKSLTVHYYMNA